jgi:transposase
VKLARSKLWAGLDVGDYSTSACVIDVQGQVLLEQAVASNPNELHALLKPLKRRLALIALEAGSTSSHLARSLRELKYDVAVLDTRKVSKFLEIRQNKTDTNDARGIAELACFGRGLISEVMVKSPEIQRLRSRLVMRQRLVRMRVAAEGTMRSLFRLNGVRLRSSFSAKALRRNVSAVLSELQEAEGIDLSEEVLPLLGLCEGIRQYLEQLDRSLAKTAKEHPVCSKFMEIVGIGPICALSFYTAIEDPSRFKRSADVGAYLGMVPKVRQSGETDKRRKISRRGSPMTRAHLVSAAFKHMRFSDSWLQARGAALEQRIGERPARMAVARKMAVMMLAMWKSNTLYDPQRGDAMSGNRIAGSEPEVEALRTS